MRRPPPPRNAARERQAGRLASAILAVRQASKQSLLSATPDGIVAAAATLVLADELAQLGEVLRAAKGVVVLDPKRVAELARGER